MEYRLPLPATAFEISRLAILLDRRDVSRTRPPSPNLPRVISCAAADVIAAVPLEPSARVLWMNPPLSAPFGKGQGCVHTEVIEARIVTLGTQARVREPARWKFRAA